MLDYFTALVASVQSAKHHLQVEATRRFNIDFSETQ
jgi:hypothetical protein